MAAGMSKNQRLIAELLAEHGRLHAYEMKKILEGVMGHGSVYGTLSALKAKGFVETEWQLPGKGSEGSGPPRKYVSLSGLGQEALGLERAYDEAVTRATRGGRRSSA